MINSKILGNLYNRKIQELSNETNLVHLNEEFQARCLTNEEIALELVKMLIYNSGYSVDRVGFMMRIGHALGTNTIRDAQDFLTRLNRFFHTEITFTQLQNLKAEHSVNGIDCDGMLHDTVQLNSEQDWLGAYSVSVIDNIQGLSIVQYEREIATIHRITTPYMNNVMQAPVDSPDNPPKGPTGNPAEVTPTEPMQKRKRGRPRKNIVQPATQTINKLLKSFGPKPEREKEFVPEVRAEEINPILVDDLDNAPFKGETSGLTAEEIDGINIENTSTKERNKGQRIYTAKEYKQINSSTLPRGLVVCRNFAEIHKALLESVDKNGRKLFEGAYSTREDGSVAFELSRLHIICIRCTHGFNAFLDDMDKKLPLCYFVLCDDKDINKERSDWKTVLFRCAKQSVIKVIAQTLNCSNKTLEERYISYTKLGTCKMDFWERNPLLRYTCAEDNGIKRNMLAATGILAIRADGSSRYDCRQLDIVSKEWEPDLGIYPGENPTISPKVKEIKEEKEKKKAMSLFD